MNEQEMTDYADGWQELFYEEQGKETLDKEEEQRHELELALEDIGRILYPRGTR